MALNPIPASVKKAWDSWGIHAGLISSLSLQIFLLLFGSLRNKTGNRAVYFLIWSAYLLADWVPTLGTGLILNNLGNGTGVRRPGDHNPEILALWAAILLRHLGSSNISAFALEDNELWNRHLASLVVQFTASLYVFLCALPNRNTKIVVAIAFTLLAGFIRYAERVRCMYLASLDIFKESVVMKTTEDTEDETQQPAESLHKLHQACQLFEAFKGLIVDVECRPGEQEESKESLQAMEADDAYMLILGELNFMYEALYTKINWRITRLGVWCFLITLASSIIAVDTFNRGLRAAGKNEFDHVDVTVTNIVLVVGLLFLDILEPSMFGYSSPRFIVNNVADIHCIPEQWWVKVEIESGVEHNLSNTMIFCRQWSESILCHNLIHYCLKAPPPRISKPKRLRSLFIGKILFFPLLVVKEATATFIRVLARTFGMYLDKQGLKDILDRALYLTRNPFDKELWDFIFADLRNKSFLPGNQARKMISEERGAGALRPGPWRSDRSELLTYIDDVDFGESLLMWHIATEICYNGEEENEDCSEAFGAGDDQVFSKVLSDYMLYLMIFQPTMISSISGIFLRRYVHTCNQASSFLRQIHLRRRGGGTLIRRACQAILDLNIPTCPRKDEAESVLYRASALAKELKRLEGEKWAVMSRVWLEMMTYAARHCRGDIHAQSLSRGGELLSMVWLLMAQFGLLGNQQLGSINREDGEFV